MDLSGDSATASFIHQDSGDHNEEIVVAVLVCFVTGARAKEVNALRLQTGSQAPH